MGQPAEGTPTGHLAEPGAYPTQCDIHPPAPHGDLSKGDNERFLGREKEPHGRDVPLLHVAQGQVLRGWLGGTHPFGASGKLFRSKEEIKVHPAFTFGVQ